MQFNWQTAQPLRPVPAVVVVHTPDGVRTCTKCLRSLPMTEFGIRNKTTGRRNTRCKECVAATSREHYQHNRESYLIRNRARKRSQSPKRSFRLEYLSTHPCVDCGEADPVLLDFDHRAGETKVDAVARLLWNRQWAAVAAEIEKCDVRCVRCHRVLAACGSRFLSGCSRVPVGEFDQECRY